MLPAELLHPAPIQAGISYTPLPSTLALLLSWALLGDITGPS